MFSSGVQRCLEPSTIDLKFTPSASSSSVSARLKIWNPPLSVKTGLSQLMNLWTPPAFLMTSVPGRR